ncbi:MAG: RDD family protein [Planctomycetota bacterium]
MPDDPTSDQPNIVLCDVTQEPVPEDETVVIQGKRVSARGKQILLDQLSTGHNLAGEIEAPGSWRRLGCAIVDGLLVGIVGGVLGAVVGGVTAAATGNLDPRVQGGTEVLSAAIAMLYYGLMHANGGQTLGKKLGKFKVINLDGSDIDTKTAMVRAFMFTGIQALSGLVLVIGGASFFVAYSAVAGAVGIYGLANAITVLVTKDKRAIHDMAAGTRAVMIDY